MGSTAKLGGGGPPIPNKCAVRATTGLRAQRRAFPAQKSKLARLTEGVPSVTGAEAHTGGTTDLPGVVAAADARARALRFHRGITVDSIGLLQSMTSSNSTRSFCVNIVFLKSL